MVCNLLINSITLDFLFFLLKYRSLWSLDYYCHCKYIMWLLRELLEFTSRINITIDVIQHSNIDFFISSITLYNSSPLHLIFARLKHLIQLNHLIFHRLNHLIFHLSGNNLPRFRSNIEVLHLRENPNHLILLHSPLLYRRLVYLVVGLTMASIQRIPLPFWEQLFRPKY